jgi:SEC-C motif-containing protein
MHDEARCPCGSNQPFDVCCGPLLTGSQQASTAEALMRSRYTAYGRHDEAYLLRTWHPSTRPGGLDLEEDLRWLGLEIVRTEAGGPDDREGMVEFVARYEAGGQAGSLREASRFVREEGRWFYVDGRIEAAKGRPGRNAPCPCGSGKKYKRCCGREA